MLYRLFATPPSDLVLRTRWYILIRWLLLVSVAVPGILSLYIGEGWSTQVQRDSLLALGAIATNALFYTLSRLRVNTYYYRGLAVSIIATDILLITYLVFTKGGVESRSPILYVVPILMSAAIFGRFAIYRTALTAITAYGALVLADYSGIIDSIGAVNPRLPEQSPYMLNTLAFFTSALLIIAAVADFITRQLIEKERLASESLQALERAQAITKVGSWEWDVINDHSVCSDEFYRITNIPRGKVSLKTYLKRVHPDDRDMVKAITDEAVTSRRPFGFDHRILLPNRAIKYLHTEGQVITDKRGKVVRVFGTTQDITAERALDKAKDEFVSLASHQLRTPATGVKTYISLLLDGFAGELSPEQRDFMMRAYRSNERQLHIIDSLLSVASIESGKISLNKMPVSLSEMVEGVVSDNARMFEERNQTVEIIKSARPVIAEIDPNRFRMILDNLLSNASKYSPDNSKITVQLASHGRKASITVTDYGIGIAKKDLPKLFLKFSRINNPTSTDTEGSGLGLYLVKYLVSLHGGKISVVSRPRRGSAFTITLPKYMPARRQSKPAETKGRLVKHGTLSAMTLKNPLHRKNHRKVK